MPLVKVIVLRGAEDFFSNGIDLNMIQASANPSEEAWKNINAIDDLVENILKTDKYVISAIQGNAGAGGVALALAADKVIASRGSVLNMHYKGMGLYGSEFWTHSLRKRIGPKQAQILTDSLEPIIGVQAYEMGLVDEIIDNFQNFEDELHYKVLNLTRNVNE